MDERHAGGDHERSARALERSAERLDGAPIGLARLLDLGEVVDVGGVDHAVRLLRAAAQAVEVLERAAVDLGAGALERRGSLVRAGEADHLVPRLEELGDDRRSDETGCAGDEYAHGKTSESSVLRELRELGAELPMSVADITLAPSMSVPVIT